MEEKRNTEDIASLRKDLSVLARENCELIKSIAVLEIKVHTMNETLERIEKSLEKLVTVNDFNPVSKIVYGGVALVLIGFVTGILSLVMIK